MYSDCLEMMGEAIEISTELSELHAVQLAKTKSEAGPAIGFLGVTISFADSYPNKIAGFSIPVGRKCKRKCLEQGQPSLLREASRP